MIGSFTVLIGPNDSGKSSLLDAIHFLHRSTQQPLWGHTSDCIFSSDPNIKRIRSAVKGVYGDDSVQYALVGGTIRSERKRPTRKPRPVETPA